MYRCEITRLIVNENALNALISAKPERFCCFRQNINLRFLSFYRLSLLNEIYVNG